MLHKICMAPRFIGMRPVKCEESRRGPLQLARIGQRSAG